MKLIAIYEQMKRTGHVIDQYSFDKTWLGRRPGYTAYIRSTGREPSVETLLKFYFRLMEIEQREARYGLNTGQLRSVAQLVFAHIQQQTKENPTKICGAIS